MRLYPTRLIAGVAVAAATVLVPTTPASASITGRIDFVCVADLPMFPTASGGGTCGVVGPVPGTAVVALAGIDTAGDPYVVAGPGTFRAFFTYFEACPVALPVTPPTGTANGTASVTGVPAVHAGQVTTARVDTQFTWIRAESTAAIITFNTRVTFANGHVAISASPVRNTVDDVAHATFAPLPTPGNCAAPAPTRALVTGTDYIPI